MKLGKNIVSNNDYVVGQFKMHFKLCSDEIYLGLITNTNIVLYVISARSNPSNPIARSKYSTRVLLLSFPLSSIFVSVPLMQTDGRIEFVALSVSFGHDTEDSL